MGARCRIDFRLRLGRVRDSGRRGASRPDGPQWNGAPAGRRSRHRVAQLGRPCADDRPGRIRGRIHSRRGLVRSRDAVTAGEPSSGPSGHLPPEGEGVAGSAAPPLSPGAGWGEGPLGDAAHHQDAPGRIDAVDCARGAALVGMAIYPLGWDLADFRLAPPMLPFTPQMRLLLHSVASAFLLLVGVSLALAHRNGLKVRAFWRRLAIVAGAAALVTAGSFVFAPSEPITFGILHCIAVASLLAGPFVTAPAWA